VAAACGAWVLVGGPTGLAVGAAAAVAAWRVLGAAEGPAARRRRLRIAQDLPVAVQLMAGCLSAGAATGRALEIVGPAIGGPLGVEFGLIASRLRLGTDPAALWRGLATDTHLAELGAALRRAHESGASVAGAIEQLAEDLQLAQRSQAEQRARTVAVRAAAPLGLCLLPAFLLLGVVPMTVGLVSSLTLLR
jgi:Flp pilus assembly protein TadB